MSLKNEKIVIHADPELRELIPGYLKNRFADATDMMEAFLKNDYEKVRAVSHAIKGSGGGYGFDGMTEIAGALEQAAKTHDATVVRQHLDLLIDYLTRVEVSDE